MRINKTSNENRSPNKKYLLNGWQTLYNLRASDSKDENAKPIEQAQWWKQPAFIKKRYIYFH